MAHDIADGKVVKILIIFACVMFIISTTINIGTSNIEFRRGTREDVKNIQKRLDVLNNDYKIFRNRIERKNAKEFEVMNERLEDVDLLWIAVSLNTKVLRKARIGYEDIRLEVLKETMGRRK